MAYPEQSSDETAHHSREECPCGLSPALCVQKHKTLDRDLDRLRVDVDRLRGEAREDIKTAESRAIEHMDTCQKHLLEKMEFTQEIGEVIAQGISESYKAAIDKVVGGLNRQGREVKEHGIHLQAIKDAVPTDAIPRLSSLEKWRWTLLGIGLCAALGSFLLGVFYNHAMDEIDDRLNNIKAIESQLKGLPVPKPQGD
jgi:hypothetical protein